MAVGEGVAVGCRMEGLKEYEKTWIVRELLVVWWVASCSIFRLCYGREGIEDNTCNFQRTLIFETSV